MRSPSRGNGQSTDVSSNCVFQLRVPLPEQSTDAGFSVRSQSSLRALVHQPPGALPGRSPMMCSQTLRDARMAKEAESKARMVAAHEFAHELLRFETRLVGFTTNLRREGSLQLPAGSRLNIYPPGRSRFERAVSAPSFRRGEAAVKTLPRPRPLSAFMSCEAASIPCRRCHTVEQRCYCLSGPSRPQPSYHPAPHRHRGHVECPLIRPVV